MVSIQADSPFPGLHPRRCVGHEADAGEGDHWQPRLWLCRVLQQVRRRGRAQEADLPRFQDPGPPPHCQVGRDQEARRQPRAGRRSMTCSPMRFLICQHGLIPFSLSRSSPFTSATCLRPVWTRASSKTYSRPTARWDFHFAAALLSFLINSHNHGRPLSFTILLCLPSLVCADRPHRPPQGHR